LEAGDAVVDASYENGRQTVSADVPHLHAKIEQVLHTLEDSVRQGVFDSYFETKGKAPKAAKAAKAPKAKAA
jgi:hypothetical protein